MRISPPKSRYRWKCTKSAPPAPVEEQQAIVAAYTSVIDAQTNDPTYVPAQ